MCYWSTVAGALSRFLIESQGGWLELRSGMRVAAPPLCRKPKFGSGSQILDQEIKFSLSNAKYFHAKELVLLHCKNRILNPLTVPITIQDAKANEAARGPGKLAIRGTANHYGRRCSARRFRTIGAFAKSVWRQNDASQPACVHNDSMATNVVEITSGYFTIVSGVVVGCRVRRFQIIPKISILTSSSVPVDSLAAARQGAQRARWCSHDRQPASTPAIFVELP